MVKSLSPLIPLSSFNSIPDKQWNSVHSHNRHVHGSLSSKQYSTTVSHQVFVKVQQLFSNVLRAGTILLVILEVKQRVDLQELKQSAL